MGVPLRQRCVRGLTPPARLRRTALPVKGRAILVLARFKPGSRLAVMTAVSVHGYGAHPPKPSAFILASYFASTCAPGVRVGFTASQSFGFRMMNQPLS